MDHRQISDPTDVSPRRRLHGDQGASLVEYAMLMALIVVVCLAAVTFFGQATKGSVSKSADSVTAAN